MVDGKRHNLPKEERLSAKLALDRLFGKDSHSMSVFPVRAVYQVCDYEENIPQVRIMISAPKRKLKLAVDRNRVKRQIREAYRLNKQYIVNDENAESKKSVMIAFIWLDKKLWATKDIQKKVKSLVQRISEKTYG